ncbi:MAG TPA: HEAT repeat domain-containing protein [Verrucomicrobiae bacterium]|nr:HEAT repeat domain-containing protein [Verrucomicrobiae bacterium]
MGAALARVATDAEHPGRQSALGYLCAWTTNADLTRPVFLVGIRDTNPAIRRLAVSGLTSMQADHVIELLDPCVKDPDRAIRVRAVASLRRFTNQVSEASARLRAALRDPDPVVRAAAAGGLAMLAASSKSSSPDVSWSAQEMANGISPSVLAELAEVDEQSARALGYFASVYSTSCGFQRRLYVPRRILERRFSAVH